MFRLVKTFLPRCKHHGASCTNTCVYLSIAKPRKLSPPALIMCFEQDALTLSYTLSSRGLRSEDSINFSANLVSSNSANETVYRLLKSTPTTDEIVREVYVRNRHGLMEQGNSSEFVIKKFFKQGYICYSFSLKNRSFLHFRLSNGLEQPKFFSLVLEGKYLRGCEVTYFYLDPQKQNFYGDNGGFAENYRTIDNLKTGGGLRNWVTLTYRTYRSRVLPWPYSSNCINYTDIGFETREHCYDSCLLRRSVEELNKVHYSVLISQKLNYTVTDFSDLTRKVTRQKLYDLESTCNDDCIQPNCFNVNHVPQIMSTTNSTQPITELFAPIEPEIQSRDVPFITMLDYLTYLLSSASFWLGFSPLVATFKLRSFLDNKQTNNTRDLNLLTSQKLRKYRLEAIQSNNYQNKRFNMIFDRLRSLESTLTSVMLLKNNHFIVQNKR